MNASRIATVIGALALALALTSCGQQQDAPRTPSVSASPVRATASGPGGLVMSLRLPGRELRQGSTIEATVSVTNSSDTTFAAVTTPHIRVMGADGNTYYDSAATLKLLERLQALAPGARLTRTVRFAAPYPGEHRVEGYVRSDPAFTDVAAITIRTK